MLYTRPPHLRGASLDGQLVPERCLLRRVRSVTRFYVALRGNENQRGRDRDLMPMKEGRRNDRERIRDQAEGKGEGRGRGRSFNEDRPTTVPTELLAVVRRFRESNLSCDHLRECLNELLGVGRGEREREKERSRAFENFYRRDILYGNAGPTGIRGEPKPHGGG